MLLVGRMVFAFDDDNVLPGEGGLHVALADLVPDADVGIADFRVDARRLRLHRLSRIVDSRQIFIFHLEPGRGL